MTYDEIVAQAKARCTVFGNDFPTTGSVLYRRIEIRQQELFSTVSRVNPDYFGVNVIGTLDENRDLNLALLETGDLSPACKITRVEIKDPGTNTELACGDKVTIIPHTDPDAGLPPRMWLRNFTLHGYKSDLDGVTSVCIYYGRRPVQKATALDGTEVAELPDVYQELLVLDLAKWMMKQTLDMDPDAKVAALEVLSAEEAAMLDTMLAEVTDYAGGQESRFGGVSGGQRL